LNEGRDLPKGQGGVVEIGQGRGKKAIAKGRAGTLGQKVTWVKK